MRESARFELTHRETEFHKQRHFETEFRNEGGDAASDPAKLQMLGALAFPRRFGYAACMSIYAPDPKIKTRKDALLNFLILLPFTLALLGCALALGIEPRMKLERTGSRVFRVTGSNHFAGVQFYSKTIEGVEGVRLASAARNDRRDSIEERNRQTKRTRLDFEAADGAVLSWQRTEDSRMIDDFMRGNAPSLGLTGTPPLWRMGLAWLSAGLGGLIFIGTIQNCFFPKR